MTEPLEVRTRLLDHAKAVVTDRNDTYGDPLADALAAHGHKEAHDV